jgi:hypothetical protein
MMLMIMMDLKDSLVKMRKRKVNWKSSISKRKDRKQNETE